MWQSGYHLENRPAGQMTRLIASAELHAATGKRLPTPELTNLRQIWIQLP